jgi:hypothetical protein
VPPIKEAINVAQENSRGATPKDNQSFINNIKLFLKENPASININPTMPPEKLTDNFMSIEEFKKLRTTSGIYSQQDVNTYKGKDSDNDGLIDILEVYYGTGVAVPDSDNDGYKDGDEVKGGYNPRGQGSLQNLIEEDRKQAASSNLVIPNNYGHYPGNAQIYKKYLSTDYFTELQNGYGNIIYEFKIPTDGNKEKLEALSSAIAVMRENINQGKSIISSDFTGLVSFVVPVSNYTGTPFITEPVERKTTVRTQLFIRKGFIVAYSQPAPGSNDYPRKILFKDSENNKCFSLSFLSFEPSFEYITGESDKFNCAENPVYSIILGQLNNLGLAVKESISPASIDNSKVNVPNSPVSSPQKIQNNTETNKINLPSLPPQEIPKDLQGVTTSASEQITAENKYFQAVKNYLSDDYFSKLNEPQTGYANRKYELERELNSVSTGLLKNKFFTEVFTEGANAGVNSLFGGMDYIKDKDGKKFTGKVGIEVYQNIEPGVQSKSTKYFYIRDGIPVAIEVWWWADKTSTGYQTMNMGSYILLIGKPGDEACIRLDYGSGNYRAGIGPCDDLIYRFQNDFYLAISDYLNFKPL